MAAMATNRTDAMGATESRMLARTASDVLATRVAPAATATDAQRGRAPCHTMARETAVTLRMSATMTAANAAIQDRKLRSPADPATKRNTSTAMTHSAKIVTTLSAALRGACRSRTTRT